MFGSSPAFALGDSTADAMSASSARGS